MFQFLWSSSSTMPVSPFSFSVLEQLLAVLLYLLPVPVLVLLPVSLSVTQGFVPCALWPALIPVEALHSRLLEPSLQFQPADGENRPPRYSNQEAPLATLQLLLSSRMARPCFCLRQPLPHVQSRLVLLSLLSLLFEL